jgi:hypothetical protein
MGQWYDLEIFSPQNRETKFRFGIKIFFTPDTVSKLEIFFFIWNIYFYQVNTLTMHINYLATALQCVKILIPYALSGFEPGICRWTRWPLCHAAVVMLEMIAWFVSGVARLLQSDGRHVHEGAAVKPEHPHERGEAEGGGGKLHSAADK